MLLIGSCIANLAGKWANRLLLLHSEQFPLKSAGKQILAGWIYIAPDDVSAHYALFKASSSPVCSHGISNKLDHKGRISSFHIDRPAVTSTLECYYPGNQPNPALRLTSTHVGLNTHRRFRSDESGGTKEPARPAAGLQAQQVSPPECPRARAHPLSRRPMLICSRCSVIQADGALQTGPTWLHSST